MIEGFERWVGGGGGGLGREGRGKQVLRGRLIAKPALISQSFADIMDFY